MVTIISKSPEETHNLGKSWANHVKSGWVIGLKGDLGAGKTQLVKGLAKGMGIEETITSPTFTLASEYQAKLPLYHLDFYRLKDDSEIIRAGLEPYFTPEGITVIEWIDRWTGSYPTHFYPVTITQIGENERQIVYEDFGS